jgi:predicted nucleic acid-binding protein
VIVDASVIVRAFLPDEAQPKAQRWLRGHVSGELKLRAPDLIIYEVSNNIWQAERRGRLRRDQADQILDAVRGLRIEFFRTEIGEMLSHARRFGLSAYEAAYIALAERLSEPLVTGDERLFNSVKNELEWVWWVGGAGLQI